MKRSLKPPQIWSIAVFFGCGFLLHLIWEHAQMPLYAGFPFSSLGTREAFLRCLFATVTGDMLFMLVLYLTLAVIHENLGWSSDPAAYERPATWAVTPLVGSLLAVAFELWAVYVAHRWEYDSMPILPVVRVGLTPVLQMIVIPVVTIAVCRWTLPSNDPRNEG